MEGPLFVPFVWATITALTAAYDRFLVPIGPNDEHFEAWCRTSPAIARIACSGGRAEDVARALAPRLARPFSAGRAALPWPHYALRGGVAIAGVDVVVTVSSASILRGRGARPPDAFELLRDLLASEAGARGAIVRRELYVDGETRDDEGRAWSLRLGGDGGLVLADVADAARAFPPMPPRPPRPPEDDW